MDSDLGPCLALAAHFNHSPAHAILGVQS